MGMSPNTTYLLNGVTVNEKIIPDGTVWRDPARASAAGFAVGSYYKANRKLSGGTGKVRFVTIHNTDYPAGATNAAMQYTAATYNEAMRSSRVQFYVDKNCAWQTLKAGTGLTAADPVGSAEVGWHAGDGVNQGGGNETSLSIEIIMGENSIADTAAKTNGAKIAAWLLWKHGLSINELVTHTYWVNRSSGNSFANRDEQSTNPVYGKKWCPAYIFASNDRTVALRNWQAFKALVKSFLDQLNGEAEDKPKTVTGTYSTGSDEDAKYIWNYLMSKIGNAYGVAGIMGNLYWESGLRSNNMENGYEAKLGFTDESYTRAVDNGTYLGFVTDSVGYGLAQWTYWTLKRDLKAFCAERGASVGDFYTQVEYLFVSIQSGFPALLKALKGASSVREASNAMLFQYERPADQGERIQNMRAAYGQYVYNKFAGSDTEEDDEMLSYEQFKEYMKQYRHELQDNDCGDWSKEGREWAIKNGLINGVGTEIDGEPNYAWADQLTREQASVLFYRLAKILGKNVNA